MVLVGEPQVPFLSWLVQTPGVVGQGLQRVVNASTGPVSSLLLGVTGQQFFLNDGTPDREPLLVSLFLCPSLPHSPIQLPLRLLGFPVGSVNVYCSCVCVNITSRSAHLLVCRCA